MFLNLTIFLLFSRVGLFLNSFLWLRNLSIFCSSYSYMFSLSNLRDVNSCSLRFEMLSSSLVVIVLNLALLLNPDIIGDTEIYFLI